MGLNKNRIFILDKNGMKVFVRYEDNLKSRTPSL